MKRQTNQKNLSLKQKLKHAIAHLHADVFGYEKSVTRNVISYFKKLSENTGIPSDQIIVRMFKQPGTIKTYVHKDGKVVREVTVGELIELFSGSSQLTGLEYKIVEKILRFMDDLKASHGDDSTEFHICFLAQQSQVRILAVYGNKVTQSIALKTLIKYFTL
ncbi:hypothetical protein HN014_10565 [Aquimarina sp. TRL1]|uniref:hypothetical protein n=1 Tax=Aquimarina sp. (strain TRL1) TaxID=2736252 RepID=UPI00158EA101|nr:hypothetical protein [Aquimarina sp. TRL1]QKX05339.1 hypothetical protein HN014_10565 [Aquimarina sp. TRL1]